MSVTPTGASPGGAPVARVALVLVSHSQSLAQGAVELAGQMAPQVHLVAAGGMDDGGLGTSYDKVEAALRDALEHADQAVVIADLGSAVLTVESVLDMEEEVAEKVRLVDAPFVEGAVAAAVTANGGADVADVAASAVAAGATFAGAESEPEAGAVGGDAASGSGVLRAVVTLRNKLGLHARPAAMMARMIAGYDASVTVNGVNGASVLEMMKLGATGGQDLTVEATGNQAADALAAVVKYVEEGFGEE